MPIDGEQQLHLEVERLRVEKLWHSIMEQYVPMAVAAATTFHQVHQTTKTIISRADYDDALNLAASALSRFMAIYEIAPQTQSELELSVNLVTQRFTQGARQLRSNDGKVYGPLFVRRSDMLSAITQIKKAGLMFSFALDSDESSLPTKNEQPGRSEITKK